VPAGALDVVEAALAALEASRRRIDDLNVYPVPDGDTGTNMTMTVRAVRDALAGARALSPAEQLTLVARSCLMGARGNSGVILSQLARGGLEELDEAPATAGELAPHLRRAADAGYAAVREPQEGTMLTVARELAERAETLEPGLPLGDALAEIVAHGEVALARTQEQLDVLRDAGVVDAGGAGVLELVRGIAAHVRGEPLPEPEVGTGPLPEEAVHRELSRYRYCTSFFVEGDGVEPGDLERELAAFGDSLLVVGGPGAVKVHVHTDEPGRALALATAAGVIEEVSIENMHVQTAVREGRLTEDEPGGGAGAAPRAGPAATAVVAVVAGAGNASLFRDLGAAAIVEGGQTMNPPTSELLAAVEEVDAAGVVLLPNNKNVVLAAEQAAAEASRPVEVIRTTTMQAGLAALVPFDPAAALDENARAMAEAADCVRAGAVARASRSAAVDGVQVEEGEFLGLVDGAAVAAGATPEEVARTVLARLLEPGADVLTILLGDAAPGIDGLRDELAASHPELEIDVHEGGQPHYPLLFAAE